MGKVFSRAKPLILHIKSYLLGGVSWCLRPFTTSYMTRQAERGNVFFTLFGAVAIVGVLGAGIMATMRGPLSTMVEVNRREQAKAELRVAANLILVNSNDDFVEVTCEGGGSGDGYTEGVQPESGSGPTGGGLLPSIGAKQNDPWGNPYGYCAWDHGGLATDYDASCARYLAGNTSTGNIAIALISAGPDGEFETSCVADNGGSNDYVEPDGGGGDDIVEAMTYNQAVSGSGGLWSLEDADTAGISKDLNVTGGAAFSEDVDLSAGSGALRLGAASMILPDESVLDDSSCNGANDGLIRINKGGSVYGVEVCQNGTGWVPAGSVWTNGTSDDIYYNTGTAQVGIGMTSPDDTLDVDGTLQVTSSVDFDGTLDVADDATFSQDLDVTLNATVGGTLDVTGDTTITGDNADDSSDALTVSDSAASVIFAVQNDGTVGIGTASPTQELDVDGDVTVSGDYMIDGTQILGTDNVSTNILLGDVTSPTPGTTANYMNLGDAVHADLTNKRVGIGFADTYDVSTFDDTLEVNGDIDVDGDIELSGGIITGDNTSGNILVADGDDFQSVAMGGDVNIDSTGDTSLQADTVDTTELVDAAVTEDKLDMSNSPTGGYCLKYLGGNLTWSGCSSDGGGDGVGGDGLPDVLANDNDADSNKITGLADPTLAQDAATKAYVDTQIGTGVTTLIDDDDDTQIQVEESDDEDIIRFDTAGFERMQIQADGDVAVDTDTLFVDAVNDRVGVGTNSPSLKLSIRHADDTWDGIYLGEISDTDGDESFRIRHFGGANSGSQIRQEGDLPLRFMTNDLERLRIAGDGNVGIGTLTPAAAFEVAGTDAILFPRGDGTNRPSVPVNGMMRYNSTSNKYEAYQNGEWQDIITSGAGGVTGLIDADGDTYIDVDTAGNGSDNTIVLATNNETRMFFEDDGTIGIGTTTPLANSALEIQSDDDADADTYGLYIDKGATYTGTLTDDRQNFGIYASVDGVFTEDTGGGHYGYTYGGVFRARHDEGDTGVDGEQVVGVYGIAQQKGSGTLAIAQAGNFSTRTFDGGGDITTAYGVDTGVLAENGGTIDIARGVFSYVYARDTGSTIAQAIGVQSVISESDTGSGFGEITEGRAFTANCDDADTCYGLYVAAGDADVGNGQDWGIYVSGEDQNYLSGQLGIGTTSPQADLHVAGTDAILFPKGTDSNRPSAVEGMMRYNTDEDKFEAYQDDAWQDIITSGAGGVVALIDADGDTKIQVEESDDEDTIRFDTAGMERMTIEDTGIIRFKAAVDEMHFQGTATVVTAGTAQAGDSLTIRSHDGTAWRDVLQTNSGDVYLVEDGGNVGIGTETPASKLHIEGGGGPTVVTSYSAAPLATDDRWDLRFVDNTDDTIAFTLWDDSASSYRNNVLALSSQGRVGINASTEPEAALDVQGTDAILFPRGTDGNRPSAVEGMMRYNTDEDKFEAYQDDAWQDIITTGGGGVTSLADDDNDTKIQVEESDDEDHIRFDTGGTERMVITDDGNVGIGTDLTPSAKLLIVEDATNNAPIHSKGRIRSGQFETSTTNAATDFLIVDADNSNDRGALQIQGDNGSTEVAFFGSGGNVGIGTSDPQAKLHIVASAVTDADYGANDGLVIEKNGSVDLKLIANPASNSSILFNDDANARGSIQYAHSTDEMSFATAGADRMLIDSDGNVGIGTAAPNNKLTVNGDLDNGFVGVAVTNSAVSASSLNETTGITFTHGGGGAASILAGKDEDFTNADNRSGFLSFHTRKDGGGDILNSSTERMRISSGGRIGIGTDTPEAILDVAGTDAILFPRGVDGDRPSSPVEGMMRYNTDEDKFEAYQDDAWQDIITSGGGSLAIDWDDIVDDMTLDADTDVTMGGYDLSFNAGSALYIDGTNNRVGIGLADPTAVLEIEDDQTNSEMLSLRHTTDTAILQLWGLDTSTNLKLAAANNAASVGTTTPDDLSFYTNDTSRIWIESTGEVGIGTTTPETALHIGSDSQQLLVATESTSGTDALVEIRGSRSNAVASDQAQLLFSNYDAGLSDTNSLGLITGRVTNDTTNIGDLVFYNYADGSTESETMRLTSDGNVGIGTDSPSQMLHLYTSDNNAYLNVESQDRTRGNLFGVENADNVVIAADEEQSGSASSIHFRIDTNERMRITNTGDVGIGTGYPEASLDVAGTGAILFPRGTDGNRPSAVEGMMRYNTDEDKFEAYQDDAWQDILTSGGGAIAIDWDDIVDDMTLDADTDVTMGGYDLSFNAGSALFIDGSNNRVGIGTTEPNSILHIQELNASALDALTLENTHGGGLSSTVMKFINMVGGNNARTWEVEATGSNVYGLNFKGQTGNSVLYLQTHYSNSEDTAVGIGTEDPDVLLHAEEDDSTDDDVTSVVRLTHTTYGTPAAGIGVGMEFETETTAGNEVIATIEAETTNVGSGTEAGDLVFNTMTGGATANEVVRMTGDNIVRIGGGTLYFNRGGGNATTASDILFGTAGLLAAETNMYFNIDADNDETSAAFIFGKDTETRLATELMRIDEDGNVGIGTDSPEVALHIARDSQQLLVSSESNTGTDSLVEIRGARSSSTGTDQAQLLFSNYDGNLSDTNSLGLITGRVTNDTTNIGDLVFYNYADGSTESETMRLTSDGNVGIGTSSPEAALDVSGTSAILFPRGTDGNRPSAVEGMMRYNTDEDKFEAYQNSAWQDILTTGGGAIAINDLTDAAKETSGNNMFIGHDGGSFGAQNIQNTAVGIGALDALDGSGSDEEGQYNTALGYDALSANTTGRSNTAVGRAALRANTTGYSNTAIGINALVFNTEGYSNTGLGAAALLDNTTGYSNTGLGQTALRDNTEGYSNTATGNAALRTNTTGYENTAIGQTALFSNTTGYGNTAIGMDAGRYIADGSTANPTSFNSVYLGMNTKALADGGENEVVIGYNATGIGDNSVVLGNDSIATTALKGDVGIGTTSPEEALDVDGNIQFSYGSILKSERASGNDVELVQVDPLDRIIIGESTSSPSGVVVLTPTDAGQGFDVRKSDGTTTAMFVENDGNVGIGTTTPEAALDVSGTDAILFPRGTDANRPSAVEGMMRYNTDEDKFEAYQDDSWQDIITSGAGALAIDWDDIVDAMTLDADTDVTMGGYDLSFNAGSALFIDGTTENVGIGTDVPSSKLTVVDDTSNNAAIYGVGRIRSGSFLTSTTNAASDFLIVDADSNSERAALQIQGGGGSNEVAFFGSGGDIGLGITAPTARLHILTGASSTGITPAGGADEIFIDKASGSAGITIGTASNVPGMLVFGDPDAAAIGRISYDHADDDMYFNTNGSERVRIDSSGNVGIGTDEPDDLLDLYSGGLRISGIAETSQTVPNADHFRIFRHNDQTTDVYGTGNNAAVIFELGDSTQADPDDSIYFFNTGNDNAPELAMSIKGSGNVGIGTTAPEAALDVAGTDAILFPRGTDGNRPSGVEGMMRYNTDEDKFEAYQNSAWQDILTTGGGSIAIDDLSDAAKEDTGYNMFIGHEGGSFGVDDTYNLAIGHTALASLDNSDADFNTAIGYNAMTANTEGYNGVAVGYGALAANTTGANNVAIGNNALRENTEGHNSLAIGINALRENTTGYRNTAVGPNALRENTEGYLNTAIGYAAGRYISDGSTANETSFRSIYIGSNTRALADGGENEIVIGHSAEGIGDNSVVLGDDSILTTVLRGDVGIGTTSPDIRLHVEEDASADSSVTSVVRLTSTNDGTGTIAAGIGVGMEFETETTAGNEIIATIEAVTTDVGSGTEAGDLVFKTMTGGAAADEAMRLTSDNIIDIEGGKMYLNRGNGNVDDGSDILFGASGVIAAENNMYFNIDSDNDDTTTAFIFGKDTETRSATELMRIDEDGDVGVGTDNPGEKLEVNGNVKADAFLTTSDIRLKEDIEAIDGLTLLSAIDGKHFTYKSSGRAAFGVIAQDVENVMPEAVFTNEETGYKTVDYQQLTPALIDAVKQLQAKVDAYEETAIAQSAAAQEDSTHTYVMAILLLIIAAQGTALVVVVNRKNKQV